MPRAGWSTGSSSGQSKGNYEETVRAAAAAQPELKVRFFGNLPDEELAEVYDRADIFAMTSVHHGESVEGFGLVYLEAAAHGLPVVAHDVGGVSEAVLDGKTGLPGAPGPARPAGGRLREADPRRGAAPQPWAKPARKWAVRNCWKKSAEALFGAAEGAA